MNAITAPPALARIAQIRSAMGRQTTLTGGSAFVLQLDTVRAAQVPAQELAATALSVDDVASLPSAVGAPVTATSSDATGAADVIPYAALFNEAGARHDVEPLLLAAVAKIESAFDPTAISPAGAQGLMQFMPATAAEMGVDPFDPTSAVDGAARYLRRELDRFGSVELALAAYNAGPGAVQRHGGIPPFAETQRYVEKVLNALESYR